MIAYITRRLLFIVPTMFGIMLVAFVVVQFAPGGPVDSFTWKPIAPGRYGGYWESYKSEIAAYELLREADLFSVGAIAGAAANAVGGLVDGAIGGVAGVAQGPALVDTTHRLNEITDSMEHRESQSHVRQVVVSSSNESEEFVTRTFSNPYRDRSLQLRFLPIYKHYEVVTRIRFGIPGLAMIAGKLDNNVQRAPQPNIVSKLSLISRLNLASDANANSAPAAGTPAVSRLVSTASVTKVALASAQVNHDDQDVRHPMVDLLTRNSSSADREKGARVEQGLRWSGAQVRDNALHVPLAEPDILTKAWKLDGRVSERLHDAISRLSVDRLPTFAPKIETRQIHLFAGTHVEAVPGECTLPDIVTDALSPPKAE
jgi:hypothetical protein